MFQYYTPKGIRCLDFMSKLFGQMHHAAQFRLVEISLPIFVPNFLNDQYLSEVSMCAPISLNSM